MKKTTTFAIAFALVACNLSVMAAPRPELHEWLNRVAVAIGPINQIEDAEMKQDLTANARLVFEEIYAKSDPQVRVTLVAPPVFVNTDNPRGVAMLLYKAQPFNIISEEAKGFIGYAMLNDNQAWGIIFIVAPDDQVLIIVVDLEALAPNLQRS